MVVLLISFIQIPALEDGTLDNLDLVELFAGVARVSKLGAWMGYKARAYDLNFLPVKHPHKPKRDKRRRGAMDINGAAGLTILDFAYWYFSF